MSRKESDKRYRDKVRKVKQEFHEKVGNACFFCDSIKTLSCHRKDGKTHKKLDNLSMQQIKKENPKDYARLCFRCHFGIHWTMKQLGLTWEEIEEFIG